MTHPFHPLSGKRLVCVGERYNRYGTRLLLRAEDSVYSVPRQWTDLVAPDPEVVFGKGCGLLRVTDLVELADLVARLRGSTLKRARGCKQNYAAHGKENLPPCRGR